MSDHKCKLIEIGKNIFSCSTCGYVHHCGPYLCDNIIFNADQTKVCKITGICFDQKLCESMSDVNTCLSNVEPTYEKKIKKDQQVKNRSLNTESINYYIRSVIEKGTITISQKIKLIHSILKLWDAFVNIVKVNNIYTHRKDKRCFVISLLYSLKTGFKLPTGEYIVMPSPNVVLAKINKKNNYRMFRVTDIRYGQKLIRKVFSMRSIRSPLPCIDI